MKNASSEAYKMYPFRVTTNEREYAKLMIGKAKGVLKGHLLGAKVPCESL